jgi:YfiH family protein
MIRKKAEGVEWLEFELLAEIPELVHGTFLRHGGISHPPFDSLNLGGEVGDRAECAPANRALVAKTLRLEKLVGGRQTHGTTLLNVPTFDGRIEESCDGVFTQDKNLGLLIKHADCQAVIFYDPIQRKVGNVHCGWRGNVQNILAHAVAFSRANPADLLVCISPSLGPLAAEFKNHATEFPPSFLPFEVAPDHFDLWALSRVQLEEAGVLPHHIQIAEICTCAHPEDFFSYRRDKVCGRNGTVVALI